MSKVLIDMCNYRLLKMKNYFATSYNDLLNIYINPDNVIAVYKYI